MVSIMLNQATHIREMEQNLEHMREDDDSDIVVISTAKIIGTMTMTNHVIIGHVTTVKSHMPEVTIDLRRKRMDMREPRSKHSCHHVDYVKSQPSWVRSLDRQSRHHLDRYEDSEDSDEMSFSDYIMSILLPKGV